MKYIALILTALFLYGCSKDTKSGKDQGSDKAVENLEVSLPAELFSSAKIDGAISITEARKLKAGDKVKVKGKIMGTANPFIKGRALFVMGDPEKLTSCDLRPGDDCPAPWDVCCDDEKMIKAGILSVQIIDSNGRVLKTGLEGKSGIKKLALVEIEGTVASNSNADAMTINADKIYVKK